MANETALIPEYIFITYDGIIKNYRPALLQGIMEKYKNAYKDFINIDLIASCSDAQLNGLVMQSIYTNILEYVAIRKFDYKKALNELYPKFDDLYIRSELLVIGYTLMRLLKEKFTSKIYIWTPSYDIRIHHDIQSTYHDMDKIEYITGSFSDVINSLENSITSYFISDVELVNELIAIGKAEYTNILVPNYGFNYTLDNDNKVVLKIPYLDSKPEDYMFKIGAFTPIDNVEIIDK